MKMVKFIRHVSAFAMNPEKAMQDMQKKHGDPFLVQLTLNRAV